MNVLIKLYQEAAVTAAVYEKVVQKTAVVGDVFNVYQESGCSANWTISI